MYELKVCSFNICKLSKANMSLKKNGSIIKKIIKEGKYSIIALQEVIDYEGVMLLAKELGPTWTGAYGRPPKMNYNDPEWKKSGKYATEGYGFLWDESKVICATTEILDSFGNSYIPKRYRSYAPRIINQDSNEMIFDRQFNLIRNPYYGRFTPRTAEGTSRLFEIRIINAHIIEGINTTSQELFDSQEYEEEEEVSINEVQLRKKEFRALSNSILPSVDNRIYGRNPLKQTDVKTGLNHYTFLMGDYNLNLKREENPTVATLAANEEHICLLGAHPREIVTFQENRTTIKKSASSEDVMNNKHCLNNYDHFTYDILKVDDLIIEIDNQWDDPIKNYYANEDNPCKKYYEEVSDHLPIGMKITYGRNSGF